MNDADRKEIQKMIEQHCMKAIEDAQEYVWTTKSYIDTRIKNLQKRMRRLEQELEA